MRSLENVRHQEGVTTVVRRTLLAVVMDNADQCLRHSDKTLSIPALLKSRSNLHQDPLHPHHQFDYAILRCVLQNSTSDLYQDPLHNLVSSKV